ncbi:MAG TPA: DUF1553 domain-containing protein, partial [Chthonomonadaceae bacterium]|nr:DUF1553 domain-containing protein [Chthonomonadaceae bacterium]
PDSAARKAGLRLDKFEEATLDRGGHAAIVKGKPEQSELIRRVTGQGPVMPPAPGHKPLAAAQIAVLKRWIAEGAEYELHWAYQPPVKPALPAVKNAAWVRSPIDRFILAKLEREGLTPAPEADRRTLARRVSLDLTGLPPEPADAEAFVRDKSPNAYEKLVDKYLASPHWGEHRGRYWLDAARYADTNGIHFDNYREMWSYRDWVVRAFNQNMPFDEFTIQQIAGDLLPNHTLDQEVATGFNRCNITSNEGGLIEEEYRVLYARDRTETTSQVFLGSTLGCAVCHDHKFDPFTQKDFYSMSAFFNHSTEPVMDGNVQNTPPVIVVPREEDRTRYAALGGEIAAAKQQVDSRKQQARADFDKWLAGPDRQATVAKLPSDRLVFHAPLSEGQGRTIEATLSGGAIKLAAAGDPKWDTGQVSAKAFTRTGPDAVEVAQAGDFDTKQPFSYAAWVRLPDANAGGAVFARMDDQHDFRGWDMWVEGGRVGTHIISKWPENALKTVTTEPLSPGKWHHVCITYDGSAKTAGVKVYVDGTARPTADQANALTGSIRTAVPFKIGQRSSSSVLVGASIQDVRLYDRLLSANEASLLASSSRAGYLLSRGPQLAPAEKDELYTWWLAGADESYRTLAGKLASLEAEERAIRARGTEAHVMHEKSDEAMAYVLARGEYDKRKDKVTPNTPAVLPSIPAGETRDRLALAKWLVRADNPLTARVTVNRFWQQVFGDGIVTTPGDFGVTGALPTNQPLLDWLAVDFREHGWDVKRFFKQVVMSAAYRQSAVVTPEKLRKDPLNKLVSRGPRFRMDAEMVRDYALAASGLLVPKIGGPSVKPYQPAGVWEAVAMIGSNTRDYKQDHGDSLYRRSMYTLWKRAAPPASMDIFNAPSREVCTVRRERTDTPLQALVTLNDVQFIEAARTLAQHAIQAGPSPEGRIDFIARRLLARPLRPEETAVVRQSLGRLTAFYNANVKDAAELIATGESKPDPKIDAGTLAAWTMLTNQMMNLDEVLNK